MRLRLSNLSAKLLILLSKDDGQDLIEYALIVALISLAAVAGMGTLAADINNAFNTVGNTLNNNI